MMSEWMASYQPLQDIFDSNKQGLFVQLLQGILGAAYFVGADIHWPEHGSDQIDQNNACTSNYFADTRIYFL
jgi:hypothetical protein